MANIPTPPSPPPSAFWWAAWYFRGFADYLKALGKSLEGVWLLGQYLASPFQSMSYYMVKASEFMNSADSEYLIVKAWVDNIVSGNGFLLLLKWASGHFDYIRNDAWSWLRLIIAGLGYYYQLFIASPTQFVNQLVRLIAPHVSSFLDDPVGFIRSQVILLNAWFFYFLYYPANWVTDRLKENFWWLDSFLTNPWFFITETVRQLFPELYSIYINPSGWFIGKISDVSRDLYGIYFNADVWVTNKFQGLTGFSASFWGNPVDYLTREIISLLEERVETFAENIANIALKLILRYM